MKFSSFLWQHAIHGELLSNCSVFICTYQKGANNKEKCNDGKGDGNQLPVPREGGGPIQSHLTSLGQLFWKPSTDPGCAQTNSVSPPPLLSFHKSAEAPQLWRPQVDERGLKPAADTGFKVDAT